jgi:hypothetical protein
MDHSYSPRSPPELRFCSNSKDNQLNQGFHMPTEQFAQQVMTKEARDQEVERQNQRKYFHEARLARFDADHTMHQADKRQHESVSMKFQAVKASFGAKRAEVSSRIEEIEYKTDLQIEAQAQSNLQLEEKKTPLIQIKNRIVGMTLTQQVIGEGVKLDVLTSEVTHFKTMANLKGYKVNEHVSAGQLAGMLLDKNSGAFKNAEG